MSTKMEYTKLAADQEANKAAELKAKLDMVEVMVKPKHGRQHRKIGEMVCDTGVKAGFQNATASFVLRLDVQAGDFIAEHGDVWYVSKSRAALKAKMDQVAKVTLDLKWTRYLRVDYKAEVPYKASWRSSQTLRIDDPRTKDTVVIGVSLEWSTVEYSDAIELPGRGASFMKRDVDEDGEAENAQETVNELPDGLVQYTENRLETLLLLRKALGVLDARMVELFRGTPAQVSRKLDEAVVGTQQLLLQAPKGPKKASR